MSGRSDYQRVRDGNCAWCGRPRQQYAWLRDECQQKHRDKQRQKAATLRVATIEQRRA